MKKDGDPFRTQTVMIVFACLLGVDISVSPEGQNCQDILMPWSRRQTKAIIQQNDLQSPAAENQRLHKGQVRTVYSNVM
jgi:hypothetical protein